MDTTPVSHRSRRGRIGIGKSISTPLQSSKKENSVLTNISASPCNNIPFVSTPTSKNISAGKRYILLLLLNFTYRVVKLYPTK